MAAETPVTGSEGTVAPSGLDARGASFWGSVVGRWDLRDDEAQLLIEVCRTLDAVERLQGVLDADGSTLSSGRVNPALPELRAQRTLLGRLLGQLALEDEAGTVLPSPASARARKAAQSRWNGHVKRGA